MKKFKELSIHDKIVINSNIIATAAFIGLVVFDTLKIKNNQNCYTKQNRNAEYASVYKPADNYSFTIDSDGKLVFSPIEQEETTLSSGLSR